MWEEIMLLLSMINCLFRRAVYPWVKISTKLDVNDLVGYVIITSCSQV